jgi:hypothetical protein
MRHSSVAWGCGWVSRWPQFFIHGFLGAFLAFQASRVRFRFSDKELDVVFVVRRPHLLSSTANHKTLSKLADLSHAQGVRKRGCAVGWSADTAAYTHTILHTSDPSPSIPHTHALHGCVVHAGTKKLARLTHRPAEE